MRWLRSLLVFGIFGFSIFWLWNHSPSARKWIENVFDSGEFLTLEAKFSAKEILANTHGTLKQTEEHKILKPKLQFYPYILFEVKYSRSDHTTGEGVIMWGMTDGEMVIDTETWQTTHGFEDCLRAGASWQDYQIINSLAKHGGALGRDALSKELQLEADVLDKWLDNVIDKHLVVRTDSQYRLHFEDPRLQVRPQTVIKQWLVSKPYKHAARAPKVYSKNRLERNAKAAFGKDFAIRSHREVFLPVYSIEVQNPDGSMRTSYWNALNGKQVFPNGLR